MYVYKSGRLDIRLTPRDLELLDQARGPLTRSAWIRNQIRNHTRGGDETPPAPAAVVEPATTHQCTWVKAGAYFDRCTTCDQRRPHQSGTRDRSSDPY